MRGIKLGLWAIFTIFIIVLAVALVNQNSEPTAIALFNYVSEPLPKYLIMIITFVLGALFSSLFFIVELIVLESRCLRLKRLNSKMERALSKEAAIAGTAAAKLPQSDILISSDDHNDV
jgi:uncharacterized integral membrane protein